MQGVWSENCKLFDWVESCKILVMIIVSCLIELRAVCRLFGELQGVWLSWELQGVWSENCKLFDWVESCNIFARRIVSCLIELRAVKT